MLLSEAFLDCLEVIDVFVALLDEGFAKKCLLVVSSVANATEDCHTSTQAT
jgi:hypothetical protein